MRAFTANDGVAYIAELERAQLERRTPEFDLSVFRPDVAQRVHDFPSAVCAALRAQEFLRGIEFETVLLRGIKEAWNELAERRDHEIKARISSAIETRNAQFDEKASVERDPDPTFAKIEKALRRLSITPQAEEFGLVRVWAHALTEMVGKWLDKGRTPPNFRAADARTVRKRLSEVAKAARLIAIKIDTVTRSQCTRAKLASLIRNLPEDAIDAMSNVETRQFDMGWFRIKLPQLLTEDKRKPGQGASKGPSMWETQEGAIMLRHIADVASEAAENPTGSAAGNIPNHHAHALAGTILGFYIKLTGDVPTSTLAGRKQEKFFSLVEEIFHIQGVAAEGDPDFYARQAVLRRHQNGKSFAKTEV